MKSVLGENFMGMYEVSAGADSKETATKVVEKITAGLKEEGCDKDSAERTANESAMEHAGKLAADCQGEDGVFLIYAKHKAGAENIETSVDGHSIDLICGATALLCNVAMTVADGDKSEAVVITKAICDYVAHRIISGEGKDDAQNAAKKTED